MTRSSLGFGLVLFLLFSGTFWAQENPVDSTKGYLGIELQMDSEGHMKIAALLPGGAAEKSGLKVGDIVLGIEGKRYETPRSFLRTISGLSAGEVLTLDILREGKSLEVDVTLGTIPEDKDWSSNPLVPQAAKKKKGFLGVEFLHTPEGLVLENVFAGGAAEKAGLKVGDILIGINGKKYSNTRRMVREIAALAPGEKATFYFLRDKEVLNAEVVMGTMTERPFEEVAPIPALPPLPQDIQGIYNPVTLEFQNEMLGTVLNEIFEQSFGRIQYLALSDNILRRRLTISVRNLGALYAAQYACVVTEAPFRAIDIGKDRNLFLIYPNWEEDSKGEKTPAKVAEPALGRGEDRPFMGLELAEDLTLEEEKEYGAKGALVLEVIRFSPAEKAGFQKMDLITQINQKEVVTAQDVVALLKNKQVGDTLNVQVIRQGKTPATLSLTLALDPLHHGLLTQSMNLRVDEARLADILQGLSEYTQGKIHYVGAAEVLTRYRFSMRIQGISIEYVLSYLFGLIRWKYSLEHISENDYLIFIVGPKK
jgi:S1-C subfamily serine protease